ncbi:DUF2278 family protein [Camelliibacillus cellulosilyticus]|uniref:DUF2278 family protein n=1 Tax=Camelliibacillus cellulosilyticus TaxID=2174486 RepID=A0ABV9GNE2_9BACL
MPVQNYGVVKGKAIKTKPGNDDSPHFQVLIQDEKDTLYRLAINIKSQSYPSNVLYFVSEDFNSSAITELPKLASGFTAVKNNQPPIGLDYVKGRLFDPKKMIPLPPDEDGPDNDLNEKIGRYFNRAIKENATIYAFGSRWGPERNKPDQYFGFTPGNGVHDIHMNQGNVGHWKQDNGAWQDGGVLIYYKSSQTWTGIFLAFQSQSWCTDDKGNAVKPVSECDHRHAHTNRR